MVHTLIRACSFGTHHGSQIFQRLSDAVHFIMRQNGRCVIDCIDDYVGIPDAASRLYQFLIGLMNRLGLTISKKKLVEPGTRVSRCIN